MCILLKIFQSHRGKPAGAPHAIDGYHIIDLNDTTDPKPACFGVVDEHTVAEIVGHLTRSFNGNNNGRIEDLSSLQVEGNKVSLRDSDAIKVYLSGWKLCEDRAGNVEASDLIKSQVGHLHELSKVRKVPKGANRRFFKELWGEGSVAWMREVLLYINWTQSHPKVKVD